MMKKILPLLIFVSFCLGAQAQTCVRDSSILQSGALLSPPYWDTTSMLYALNDACINHAYNQSVTVNVPASYQGFPINSVSIATTGALTNIPMGITYSCDPPNCVFPASTLGCILLYGTPTTDNTAPDTFDLHILANINLPFGSLPLMFPNDLPGDNHYYLALKTEACLVGVYDHNSSLGYVKNTPNPFSDETTIKVESLVAGTFQFEVFNLVGQRVHARTLHLDAGVNEFTFNGSNLPNGSYFYTLGNQNGKVAHRIIISR